MQGITPFGSSRAWPVVLDASAIEFERVSVGGGGFGVSVHLAPADLAGHFAADVVDVSMSTPRRRLATRNSEGSVWHHRWRCSLDRWPCRSLRRL